MPGKAVKPVAKPSRQKLAHLAWAIPVAFVLACVPICVGLLGFCAGDRGGCAAVAPVGGEIQFTMSYVVVGALLFFAVIAVAPWTISARSRLTLAAACGVGVVVCGLAFLLTAANPAAYW